MRPYRHLLLTTVLVLALSAGCSSTETRTDAVASADVADESLAGGADDAAGADEVDDDPSTEDVAPEPDPVPRNDALLDAGGWRIDLPEVSFELAVDEPTYLTRAGLWDPDDWMWFQAEGADEDMYVTLIPIRGVYRSEENRYQPIAAPKDVRRWVENGNHSAFEIADIDDYDHPDYEAFQFRASAVPGNVFEDFDLPPTLFMAKYTNDPDEGEKWWSYEHHTYDPHHYVVLNIDGLWIAAISTPDAAAYATSIVDALADTSA